MITIIAAIDKNNAIGRNGQLLVKLSDDLKRFRRLTIGKTIIMGRKTYDSIGHALPNRRNIVLSRSTTALSDAEVYACLEDALAACNNDCFVIGGAQIYEQAMPIADKLELTHIDAEFDADAYFPVIDSTWHCTDIEHCKQDAGLQYAFATYVRT